jgi:hypothetical protein
VFSSVKIFKGALALDHWEFFHIKGHSLFIFKLSAKAGTALTTIPDFSSMTVTQTVPSQTRLYSRLLAFVENELDMTVTFSA